MADDNYPKTADVVLGSPTEDNVASLCLAISPTIFCTHTGSRWKSRPSCLWIKRPLVSYVTSNLVLLNGHQPERVFFILHSGRFTIYLTLDSIKGIQWTIVSIVITTCTDLCRHPWPPSVDASTNTGTLLYISYFIEWHFLDTRNILFEVIFPTLA